MARFRTCFAIFKGKEDKFYGYFFTGRDFFSGRRRRRVDRPNQWPIFTAATAARAARATATPFVQSIDLTSLLPPFKTRTALKSQPKGSPDMMSTSEGEGVMERQM